MTELVIAIHAVVQQLGYDAVSRLQQRLEMAYSFPRVPCLMALTSVFGAAATSILWKGEKSGEEKESAPSDGWSVETGNGSAKETRPRWSGKGRSARRHFCLVLTSCSSSANK